MLPAPPQDRSPLGFQRLSGVLTIFLSILGLADPTSAQVVQLPTLRQFGIGTTIVVPDRGTAVLGSVSRGAWGSTYRGTPLLGSIPGVARPFRQHATGGSLGVSQASVTATILDLEALDREVLAEGQKRREAQDRQAAIRAGIEPRSEAQRRRATFLDRAMGRSSPPPR